MNPSTATVFSEPTLSAPGSRSPFHRILTNWTPDIWTFLCILLAVNTHIFTGDSQSALIFLPSEDRQAWLRLFFHPFVHVSWYHLLLDAGAFFLLYTGLAEKRMPVRLLYMAVCGVASLLFALAFSPLTVTAGLCGLSGIAHGLMAVSGLEMMQTPDQRKIGARSLAAVVFKSLYEIITGDVLFTFLQLGMCGSPIAACHAGGAFGGIFIHVVLRISGKGSQNAEGGTITGRK